MKHLLKNNISIEIVEARKEDAAAMISYFKIVAEETTNLSFSADEFNITVEQEENLLENYHSSKNQIYLIAKDTDHIIAALSVASSSRKRTRHVGEFGISVLKEYWNLGIGKLLLKKMLIWAEKNGVTKKIMLRTTPKNINAIGLYKKLGFIQEALLKDDFKVGNEYQDTIFMSKFMN